MSKKITKNILDKLDKGLDKFYDGNPKPGKENMQWVFPTAGMENDHFMSMADRSDGGPFMDDEYREFEEHIQAMKVTPITEEELEAIGKTPHDPKNPQRGCTTKHPPLSFEIDGKIGNIYGSSCSDPIFAADLFISLDDNAPVFPFEQPWYENELNQKHVRYFIKDYSVPDDSQEFDLCVELAIKTLSEGKTVHVGCISGHGRTGMFLSTVVQKMIGDELKQEGISAIDYVRDNYCARVVETLEQIMFLHANFDISIPKKEFEEVKEIKKKFKEEIGVSLDEVIALGEYDACTDVILELEKQILLTKKFHGLPMKGNFSHSIKSVGKPQAVPTFNLDKDFEDANVPRFDKDFFTKKPKM